MSPPPTKLWGRVTASRSDGGVRVLRVSSASTLDSSPEKCAIWEHDASSGTSSEALILTTRAVTPAEGLPLRISLPAELAYLSEGDVIRIEPASGSLNVLFRASSRFNAMLVTERCNSNCVMCSQPPKATDDSHILESLLEAVPLIDPSAKEIGITGGEPTLLGEGLYQLLALLRDRLPQTSVHLLSNGRLFAYLSEAQKLAAIGHPDLMLGIPLYSDVPWVHDFVVQAHGAHDQTLRGLMNLARVGVRIELRFVIHRETYRGLPRFAAFVARHLPFVSHVALMGLELTGHVPMHLDALWIDPLDYQGELAESVRILDAAGIRPIIFNHQLCTLERDLWPFAAKSISDWKNIYRSECDSCDAKAECGGFFASSGLRVSKGIRAIRNSLVVESTAASLDNSQ